MDGKLLVGGQFLPLCLDVGQRNDGVICTGCGRGGGGERTREMPVGNPDGANKTGSVHLGG